MSPRREQLLERLAVHWHRHALYLLYPWGTWKELHELAQAEVGRSPEATLLLHKILAKGRHWLPAVVEAHIISKKAYVRYLNNRGGR